MYSAADNAIKIFRLKKVPKLTEFADRSCLMEIGYELLELSVLKAHFFLKMQ